MTETGRSLRKDLTSEQFEELRDWIHRHSGIFLDSSRLDPLRISLVARATRLGFSDHADYFELLKRDEREFKELMNLVTINETSFFRFPGQFDALSHHVVSEILETKSEASRSFRAWSAGCSTGEEPYSIAMALLGSPLSGEGIVPEVLGTDVSTQALDRAREAVYRAKSLANLPQPIVQQWFEPIAGGHRPIERVREVVEFSYHNLIKEPYPLALMGNWDVIFCRNVTIYFKFDSTRRVVDNFFESLNPGGYLFIGHSETLTSISDRFEVVEVGGVFLYRKPRRRARVSFSELLASRERGDPSPETLDVRAGAKGRAVDLANASAEDSVLLEPGPAAAPESGSVEESVSDAYRFLELGRPVEARYAADKALVRDPESIEALIVRAYTHADDGDLESAAGEARRVLEIDPLVAPAYYILGIIHQRQGDQDGALEAFKRTIYVDRDFVLAHFNLANLRKARGELKEACRDYRNTLTALTASPEGPWTAFLGGFSPGLLAQTCERSLIECRKGSSRT
jgi:chemotaxis protein methyltransferase CheR